MNDSVNTSSRRDFLRNIASSGLLMMGTSSFLQSCAEKGVTPSAGLARAYIERIVGIIEKIRERELPKIRKAAMLAVQAKLQGYDLYAYMGGNMFPHEISPSRPGSPHIFLTENISRALKGDVVFTNDPEIARGLGEQYVKVIGITTPSIPNFLTPPGTHENMGVLLIEDVADIVIYCHVPYTDGILNVEGIDIPICPASGVIHSLVYYAIVAEIVEGFTRSAIYPEIG